jgi:hypothetical protein
MVLLFSKYIYEYLLAHQNERMNESFVREVYWKLTILM